MYTQFANLLGCVMNADRTTYHDFGKARQSLSEILLQLADGFTKLETEKRANSLRVTRDSLLDDAFRVLVLGEFSRGKSTLINAMLGEQVLPAKVAPCTAVITRLKFGERKEASLKFRDGREEMIDLLSMPDELKRRITIIDQEKSPIEYCEVRYPLRLLRDGVELVDSPGLNESDTRSEITRGFFERSDAMIFVLNCEHAFAASERSFLETELRDRDLRDVFFLWNRFDAIRDSPEDLHDIQKLSREKLESRVAGRPRVFYVSARDALKSRLSSNPSLLDSSNIPAFETALEDFLATERARVKLRGPIKVAKAAVDECLQKIIPQREALARRPLEDLKRIAAQQRPRLEAAERQQERILRTIDKRGQTIQRETASAIRSLVLELEAGISKTASGIDVSTWEAISKQDAASQRIGQTLKSWAEQHIEGWKHEQFEPIFEIAFSDLETELNEEVGELLSNLDQLDIELAGNDVTASTSETALSRLVNSGGSNKNPLGSILDLVVRDSSDNLSNGAIAVAAGVGLAFLHLPILIIGGAVLAVGAGRAFLRGQRMVDDMKSAAIEELMRAIREKQTDMESAACDKIERFIGSIRTAVATKLTIRVDEVRGQVEAVIRKKEEQEAQAETQLSLLSDVRDLFQRLEQELKTVAGQYAIE